MAVLKEFCGGQLVAHTVECPIGPGTWRNCRATRNNIDSSSVAIPIRTGIAFIKTHLDMEWARIERLGVSLTLKFVLAIATLLGWTVAF